MSAFALRMAGVRFADRRALHDVDLEARAGQLVALVGPSGAGKTTLMRLLAAALRPDAGQVEVLGRSTSGLWGRALRALRTEIGLMGQADDLVPGLRVFHNVAMGRLGQWSSARALATLVWPRRADISEVEAALADVELDARLWAWPEELSTGERQRVALARLVLQRGRLWLADEPIAALDERLRADALRLLVERARRGRATLVVSLHDPDLLGVGFERVIGLRGGRVVFDGAPDRFDASERAALYAAGG